MLVNIACYSHTHRLADGSIVTHAHPYSKSTDNQPFKSHHHTKAEFIIINALSLLFSLLIVASIFINSVNTKAESEFIIASYSLESLQIQRGRAPPIY